VRDLPLWRCDPIEPTRSGLFALGAPFYSYVAYRNNQRREEEMAKLPRDHVFPEGPVDDRDVVCCVSCMHQGRPLTISYSGSGTLCKALGWAGRVGSVSGMVCHDTTSLNYGGSRTLSR
jgi:hypothetical protein